MNNDDSTILVNKCQDCELYEECDYDVDNCIMKETYWYEMSYYRYVDVILEFKHSEL